MFKKLIPSALLACTVLLAAVPADAYIGETRSIPSHNGATASATLTRFAGGSARATVRLWRGGNGRCVYVLAAPYAVFAADGGYKEVPGSRTCSSSTSTYTDSFHLAYNGLKFKICQDNPWSSDTCGGVAHIRG